MVGRKYKFRPFQKISAKMNSTINSKINPSRRFHFPRHCYIPWHLFFSYRKCGQNLLFHGPRLRILILMWYFVSIHGKYSSDKRMRLLSNCIFCRLFIFLRWHILFQRRLSAKLDKIYSFCEFLGLRLMKPASLTRRSTSYGLC